ncbi:MAG: alanine--tRNA ligase [Candidatus Omnitrophica bacterium CG11_big_fil_rev_8_21_14_0_20_42_13]|uniref:Alanine--tRNA ligase n=1 Tax=Candidatus Ghiorseimicrobium undicola TaxID=1974746 RepID=A0A2H0LVI2_9BACT|nr:MAG: alanine--tRNA ligase [Candidatus Omnitrophica bacterium CG11_big_fil_rev_8_21_14_0_20_42_13]
MKTDALRHKFLDFFKEKGHKIFVSDSLVPADDPTVLFTSAGMNQFKRQFLGQATDFRRAASCQKCLRTGDLENVGKTSGHHTFFEMLGNFSFGDYFKKEAITWAWEFVTERLGISCDKLWVSVYDNDDEAYKIWQGLVKIPRERIMKFGDKDNFWPANAILQGPDGPCGPCSEIFYDWGENEGCKKSDCSLRCSCGRFVEIWNLVFTQFNRVGRNNLEALPQKNIDTGMGLERIAAVMQGKRTNFEIDIFGPIVKEIMNIAVFSSPNMQEIYAIADHLRAVVFAICDGVIPSNEDRGYVVRKLIRRAFLNARQYGNKDPFLYRIVPKVADIMKVAYPELESERERISLVVKSEEERFCRTLSEGDRMLGEMKGIANKKRLTAEEAFKLYDTYGYPLDFLKERGVKFDQEAVNRLLEEQRSRSKNASSLTGEVFGGISSCGAGFNTEFVGYEKDSVKAKILSVNKQNDEICLILEKSCFYPESGGQCGDKGIIKTTSSLAEVYDTKKINQAILHYVKIKKGDFHAGEEAEAIVDSSRRLDTARNHTATHLLQASLRKVLGGHVRQQGSFVCEEYLRFDFTHFKALNKEEFFRVEEMVNQYIRDNDLVSKEEMTFLKAREAGALAFFAEKYADKVRVVSCGDYSKELCGGIHLDNTGQIGLFKIVSESSISSGIRRIEALTGKHAYKKLQEEERVIDELVEEFKVPKDRLKGEIEKKLKYIKKLEKDLFSAKLKLLKQDAPELLKNSTDVGGVKLIVADLKVNDMHYARSALDILRNKVSAPFAIFLFSLVGGGGTFIMALSEDLAEKGYDARKIVNKLGLAGGGRPDLVQGGMKNKATKQEGALWEEILSSPAGALKAIGKLLQSENN